MAQILTTGVRMSIVGHWTNNRAVTNVLHYIVFSDGDRTTAVVNAAGIVILAWQENILPGVADNYTLERLDYMDMHEAAGVTGSVPPNPAFPSIGGSIGASAMPPNAAVLVRKNVEGARRNTRSGRLFLPPGDEGGVNEVGTITNTAAAQARVDGFFADTNLTAPAASITEMFMVIPHWPTIVDPSPPKPPRIVDPDGVGTFVRVVGLTVDSLISSQRRRLRG